MNIALEHTEQVFEFLEAAKAEGHKWITFDYQPDGNLNPHQLHSVHSVAEAEDFCDAYYYSNDFPELLNLENYRYMAIDSLIHSLTHLTKMPEISMGNVTGLMREQSVYLLSGGKYDQMEAVFQRGELFPVVWKKPVIAQEEVAQYHVVQHEHSGGQLYEVGHRHRVMESFPAFEQAKEFMEHAVNLSAFMQEKYDYLLVGQYHNKPLTLDMEGMTDANCGLTFISANYQYNVEAQAKEYVWHPIHSLQDIVSLEQHMFAIYNPANNQLKLYDGALMEAKPQDCVTSIYPAHFNYYDSITIQNLKIMNEKNLEDLKTGARYDGFGNHLNQQLEQNIKAGVPEFKAFYEFEMSNKDKMEFARHYKVGDKDERYFYNRMDATLKQPGENEAGVTQSFYGNQNITALEAYNLLSPDNRAVHKTYHVYEKIGEGENAKYKWTDETYNTWVQLDFSKKDQYGNFELKKYGEFDVKKVANDLGFKEMQDMDKAERFITSVKKGNLTEGTIERNGIEEKVSVAANPENYNYKVYDKDMNRIDLDELKAAKKQAQSQDKEQVQNQKKSKSVKP